MLWWKEGVSLRADTPPLISGDIPMVTQSNETVKPQPNTIAELFPLTLGKYADRVWARNPMALALIADSPSHSQHHPLIELELMHRQTIALETMARAQEVQAERLSALCEWLPKALGAFHTGITEGLESVAHEVMGVGVGR